MWKKKKMIRTLSTPTRTFIILSAVCVILFILLNLQISAPFIHWLAGIDRAVMVVLNHDGGPCADHFWKTISSNMAWVPVGAALILSFAYYKKSLLISILIVVGIALTIVLADQISSSFLKPYFGRLRPSHNEEISSLLHYVGNYRGGRFGFVSSHSANAFGVLAFLAPVFRHKAATIVLFIWACLVVYSRIYLGVHYPGDIVAGAILGVTVGTGVSIAMRAAYFKILDLKRKLAVMQGHRISIESSIVTVAIVATGLYLLFYNFSQAAPLPYTATRFLATL